MRQVLYGAGMLTVLASLATPLVASIATVPEIDGTSLTAGLAVLAGAVMIVRSRIRRR
jgi:hypothetical protein